MQTPLLSVQGHGLGSFSHVALITGMRKLSLYPLASKDNLSRPWRRHYIPRSAPPSPSCANTSALVNHFLIS